MSLSRSFSDEVICPECGRRNVPTGYAVLDVDEHPVGADNPDQLLPKCVACEHEVGSGVLVVRRRPAPSLIWVQRGDPSDAALKRASGLASSLRDAPLDDHDRLCVMPPHLAIYVLARDPTLDLASPPKDSPSGYRGFLDWWAKQVLRPLVESFVNTADWDSARRYVEDHPLLLLPAASVVADSGGDYFVQRAQAYRQHAELLRVASTHGLDVAFPLPDPIMERAQEAMRMVFTGPTPSDLAGAERDMAAAIPLLSGDTERIDRARLYQARGRVARFLGKWGSAHTYFETALTLYQHLGDRRSEISTYEDLGQLVRWTEDYDLSATYLETAIRLAEEAEDRLGAIHAHLEMGILCHARHQDEAAKHQFEMALRMSQEVGDRWSEAVIRKELGKVFLDEDVVEAAHHLEIALELAQQRDDGWTLAHVHRHLGALARRQGDAGAARMHLGVALEVYEAARVPTAQANIHHELAVLDRLEGNLDGARRHLQVARRMYRQLGERSYEANVLVELSRLFDPTDQGQAAQGLSLLLEAVRLYESVRSAQGSAEARATFYRTQRPHYLAALLFAAELEDGRAALEISEAARADGLAAVLRRGRPQVSGEVADILERIRLVEAAAAHTDQAAFADERRPLPQATRSSVRSDMAADLVALYEELAVATSAVFAAAYAPAPASGDPDDVRAGLPRGTHLLIYELLAPGDDWDDWIVFCTWLAPQGEPHVSATELSVPVQRLLSRYGARDHHVPYEDDVEVYAQLGEALLPVELADLLVDCGTNVPLELAIVPAGMLWALPWAAIRVGGHRLIEVAALGFLPSLGVQAALARRQAVPAADGVVVCAGSHGELDASTELEVIKQVFDVVERVEPQALVSRLQHGPPRKHVVVTAVHGEPPEGTTLGLGHSVDLGGGLRLTAGELLSANLGGQLTLGTCFVAAPILQPGDEPLTLPTVALCAGADTVVAGVFAVPDRSTAAILSSYYRQLAAAVLPHHALRLAQLEYLAGAPEAAPAFWAGLVATGLAPDTATV